MLFKKLLGFEGCLRLKFWFFWGEEERELLVENLVVGVFVLKGEKCMVGHWVAVSVTWYCYSHMIACDLVLAQV